MRIIVALIIVTSFREKMLGQCQDSSSFISSRIINGENARPNQAPWMAAIIRDDEDYFCGAALIGQRHVLTAAHCIDRYTPDRVAVLLGTQDLLADDGIEVRAKKLDISPDHDTRDSPGVGIITLEKEVELSDSLRTISLADARAPTDAVATLTGFGHTQKTEGYMSEYLQTLPVRIVDRSRCAESLKGLLTIGPESLCGYTSRTQGACSGDSGSPLVYRNRVVGIAQSVQPECAGGKPDVYMEITYYRDFIKKIIGYY